MRTIRATWLTVVASLRLAIPAQAWWGDGRKLDFTEFLTEAAVLALPEEMPAFFRQGGDIPSHTAFDPDLFKNRRTPLLSHAEHGEHYFDLEYLGGRAIPAKRFDFIALCFELQLDPPRVGLTHGPLRHRRVDRAASRGLCRASPVARRTRRFNRSALSMRACSPTMPRHLPAPTHNPELRRQDASGRHGCRQGHSRTGGFSGGTAWLCARGVGSRAGRCSL